jgi:hypothetical protein
MSRLDELCRLSLLIHRRGKLEQGFSKVEDPSQGLVRMRSEAPTLASDVGNLVHIHQGEHEAVEHSQHLGHRRQAHAAPILAQGGIAAEVGADFPRTNAP